jgi:tetratricopeptide (TPR) repeat protein
MRRARGMCFGALLVLAVSGISPAAAQTPQPTVESDASSRAEALFREGNTLVAQQRWAEAEAKFLAAWELSPTYDIAANLGHTQYRMGKFSDAAERLNFALRNWPVTGKREARELAAQRLEELRKVVASVRVTVSTPGATVFVDGRAAGTSPIEHEIFVQPGTRTIEAKLAGHNDAKRVVEAEKGQQLSVELSPALTPAPAAVRPPATYDVPAGRSWVPAIALGAASVVGLGVGIVTTVASNRASSDADAQRVAILQAGGQCVAPPAAIVDRCAELSSSLSRVDTYAKVAQLAYAASGALAIGAIVYVLWPQPTPVSASGLQVLPAIDARNVGMVVLGGW